MRGSVLDRQHSRSSGGRFRGRTPANLELEDRAEKPAAFFHSSASNRRNSTGDIALSFCSADRSSFSSDQDFLFPHLSSILNLAARSSAGPDPHPNKKTATALSPVLHKKNPPIKWAAAAAPHQGIKQEQAAADPSKRSFSDDLKECQKNRRFRSDPESLSKGKPRKHRPASFDLYGDAAITSPRFLLRSLSAMKKSSAASSSSISKTGTFPSPGTPTYLYHKGWSSERVPLPANSSRRHMAGVAVLPFNNGRAIPSKWEDAEKWIFSPVGNENVGLSSVPLVHHRRPKSKSGPIGPPAYMSMSSSSAASPLNPCFDSGRVGVFSGCSPFLTGVTVVDRGSCDSGSNGRGSGGGDGGGGRSSSANAEPYILRSASIHGWSDAMVELCSSLPSSQGTGSEEKTDPTSGAGNMLPCAVSRKDVATQMSPDGSTHSSPKGQYLSPSPSSHPIEELENQIPKLEAVRDVQVDDRVTVTRWSKKHLARGSDKRSVSIIEWRKKTMEAKDDGSSRWEVTETENSISKHKREEAKITAWENLQKAKAEAAIRKLEMKLEKKRSSSMDKIMNKLKSAQRKAQEMRTEKDRDQPQQIAKSTNKRNSHFPRSGQISSLSGCFICPAF